MKKIQILLMWIAICLAFISGFKFHQAYSERTDLTIYLKDTYYVGVDLENDKTITDNDLNNLIKYCNENNYRIIGIVDSTCK